MLTNIELLGESEADLKWLNENYREVQEKFAGKIIAVKCKKVVAVAKTSEELLTDLKSKGIDSSEVLIKIIPLKNEITILW